MRSGSTWGWVSMKLINRGWSINAARKTVMLCCACGVAPVFLVPLKIGLWPSQQAYSICCPKSRSPDQRD